ncbi:MAG: carbamoyltransferase [Candidatus Dojkabacteria bacterium]
MYILGISCFYHDASAVLLKDGSVVAAANEERFTRIKHDPAFPEKAVEFCLRSQSKTINDVDQVGFYEKPLNKFERVMSQHLQMFPFSYKVFLNSTPSWLKTKIRILNIIRKKLKYKKNVVFVNHHLAHAASAFLPSPFKRAAIVTVDGVGEWYTTTFGTAKQKDIKLQKAIKFPHSLGLLYSTITAYLGFRVNNSEYKVMGLSAYGQTNRAKNKYYDLLKNVIDLKSDGSYRLDMKYFRYHSTDRMPSKKLCKLLGGGVRVPESKIQQRHMDIAAALQMISEDMMFTILNHVHTQTGEKNLVLAGGVALNSVINGKLLEKTPFEKVWIQPNASDGGTSMGVALHIHANVLDYKRKYRLKSPYLGPEYSDQFVENFLKRNKIEFKKFQNTTDLLQTTAKLLWENKVIAWFQGRMEWGPRALGARSILANPLHKEMQAILNKKVKKREEFRPFAPVVWFDDVNEYFEAGDPVPEPVDFMLQVHTIRKQYQGMFPAIEHVDNTARPQTIKREQNPLYYDLIGEFKKLSGHSILVNTSFNVRGEPIVCTPADAVRCILGTEIDYLVINKFLVKRSDNLSIETINE